MAIKISAKLKLKPILLGVALLLGVIGAQVYSTQFADAANKTWTGAGADNNFSTAENWSDNSVPQDGDALIFDLATKPAGHIELTNDLVNLALTGISFTNNSTDGSYTIVGNELTLEGTVGIDEVYFQGGAQNSPAPGATISTDITLSGTLAVRGVNIGSADGDLSISTNSHGLNIGASIGQCSSTGINSMLSGDGTVTIEAPQVPFGTDSNAVNLHGNNTAYSGEIRVEAGAILAATSEAINTADLIVSSGTLSLVSPRQEPYTYTINAPMQLAGVLLADKSFGQWNTGCAGDAFPFDRNFVLAGGVELTGNLNYIADGDDFTGDGINTHISGPYRPHQFTITNAGQPDGEHVAGVLTTSTPILDTAPAAPTGLAATPAVGQIALSWTAPTDNGGRAITDYQVQYRQTGAGTWNTFSDDVSTDTSATITGLANGQAYDVQVAAINAIGTGAYVTLNSQSTPAVAPSAPTSLVATPAHNQVTLSWGAPADNGGAAVTGYVVEYQAEGASNWTEFSASATSPVTITNLSGSTEYNFRVSATNSADTGPAVSGSATVPADLTAPGAPTGLTVDTQEGGEAELNWSAPASDGGSAVTGYTVEYKLSSDSTWTEFGDGTSTATSATITSLTAGSSYDFRVAATNSTGTGDPATVSNIAMPASAPSAPTNLVAAPDHNQVTLSWSAPANNGGASVIDYTVEYQVAGASSWTEFSTSAASPVTITGLTGSTAYNFQVSARNSAGTGSAASVNATVPADLTAPSAPTNLVVGAQIGGAAELSWSVPASDGGSAITGYEVQYRLSSTTTWSSALQTTATNLEVTGLDGGQPYDFRVRAINAIAASSYATETEVRLPGLPGSPSNIQSTASGTQIGLTWAAPADNGGLAITDYVIEYKLGSSSTWLEWNNGVSSVTGTTITGLVNGETYDVRISAVTPAGTGQAAQPAEGITIPLDATAPSTPRTLTATPADSEVSLAWLAPANDGGEPVTDYLIEYQVVGDSTWTTFNDGVSTNLSTVVTGLTNGQDYNFQVSAINSVGTSQPVDISNVSVVADPTEPSAPTNLQAAINQSNQVVLSWTIPASDGGTPITDYLIEYKLSGEADWTAIPHQAANGNNFTVTSGLVNGQTYDFRVSAVNGVGTGQGVELANYLYEYEIDEEDSAQPDEDSTSGGVIGGDVPSAPDTGAAPQISTAVTFAAVSFIGLLTAGAATLRRRLQRVSIS